jgi:FkbM family methyltransferase
MNIIFSKYDDGEVGAVQFATKSSSSDAYSTWVREKWQVEPVTLLACSLLSDGEPFIDLGANIGAFCLPLAIHRKSPFLAIEALKDNAELLTAAIEKNGILNATVLNVAVMDKAGVVHIKGESAYGTVNDDGEGVTIDAVAGDQIFSKYGFDNARLVKIDIEGAELKALDGMGRFVEDKSRMYIFEANGAHAYDGGYMPSDLVERFEALDHQIYMVVGRKLVPYNSDQIQPFGLINYLALPQIPDSLDFGFRVMPLKDEEVISGVIRTLTQMLPGYRSFMLKELEKAPKNIRDDARVIEAIRNNAG